MDTGICQEILSKTTKSIRGDKLTTAQILTGHNLKAPVRKHRLYRETQRCMWETQRYTGDTLYMGNTTLYVEDTTLYMGDTTLYMGDTK